jgi:hypothetical protein
VPAAPRAAWPRNPTTARISEYVNTAMFSVEFVKRT